MLASAGDDGNVIFWVPSETAKPVAMGEDHLEDKEIWREKHMCRTSSGAEIYDLAWSPDGVFIITGGVDNTARIFNAHTGKQYTEILQHILTSIRYDGSANCGTQPFCSRCRVGSLERVRCYTIF